MTQRRGRLLLAFAALLAQAQASPLVLYQVASIRSDVQAMAKIGNRKSGHFCLPAGRIEARDVRLDGNDGAVVIARALEKQGIAVADPRDESDAPDASRTIVVTVRRLRLDACIPQWGIVKRIAGHTTVKGKGEVEAEFVVRDRKTRKEQARWVRMRAFDFRRDDVDLSAVVAEQLAILSADLAPDLPR